MFRAVFPSIIRSSGLYIQQQAYAKQILLHAASGDEVEIHSSSISFSLASENEMSNEISKEIFAIAVFSYAVVMCTEICYSKKYHHANP
jgi:hypothetical protein